MIGFNWKAAQLLLVLGTVPLLSLAQSSSPCGLNAAGTYTGQGCYQNSTYCSSNGGIAGDTCEPACLADLSNPPADIQAKFNALCPSSNGAAGSANNIVLRTPCSSDGCVIEYCCDTQPSGSSSQCPATPEYPSPGQLFHFSSSGDFCGPPNFCPVLSGQSAAGQCPSGTVSDNFVYDIGPTQACTCSLYYCDTAADTSCFGPCNVQWCCYGHTALGGEGLNPQQAETNLPSSSFYGEPGDCTASPTGGGSAPTPPPPPPPPPPPTSTSPDTTTPPPDTGGGSTTSPSGPDETGAPSPYCDFVDTLGDVCTLGGLLVSTFASVCPTATGVDALLAGITGLVTVVDLDQHATSTDTSAQLARAAAGATSSSLLTSALITIGEQYLPLVLMATPVGEIYEATCAFLGGAGLGFSACTAALDADEYTNADGCHSGSTRRGLRKSESPSRVVIEKRQSTVCDTILSLIPASVCQGAQLQADCASGDVLSAQQFLTGVGVDVGDILSLCTQIPYSDLAALCDVRNAAAAVADYCTPPANSAPSDGTRKRARAVRFAKEQLDDHVDVW